MTIRTLVILGGYWLSLVAGCVHIADRPPVSTDSQRWELKGHLTIPSLIIPGSPESGRYRSGKYSTSDALGGQRLQGLSAVHYRGANRLLVLTDNGFGLKSNSLDALLYIHQLRVGFAPVFMGRSEAELEQSFQLCDPLHYYPFPVVADVSRRQVPADIRRAIERGRCFTGADLDPESMVVAPDGGLWIGEEFGPSLLHFSASGELLEPPFFLPGGLRSPDHPNAGDPYRPAVRRSKGIESLALDPVSGELIVLLEGPLITDSDQQRVPYFVFDISKRVFRDRAGYLALSKPFVEGDYAQRFKFGDSAFYDGELLVIETDDGSGEDGEQRAQHKKLIAFNLNAGQSVHKGREVVDLLHIAVNSDAKDYISFPHITIEGLFSLGDELLFCTDNNYPRTDHAARRLKSGEAELTECALIKSGA